MNKRKSKLATAAKPSPRFAGSVSFFWPLSKDHEPDRPATLAYQCCAGLRPTYSKCIHRYENGSWLASASIDPVFTAEDLILIAADMLTRTPNPNFQAGGTL
jgi:hypothetical protein